MLLHNCIPQIHSECEDMTPNLEHQGFKSVTRVNDALRKFLEALGTPRIKLGRINPEDALGRVLGKDVLANMYIPSTDRSVVDGYALRADDVQNASENSPVVLEVIGESRIGEICRARVTSGEAVAVATGSMIPPGADAVVMVEHTKSLPGRRIEVRLPVRCFT